MFQKKIRFENEEKIFNNLQQLRRMVIDRGSGKVATVVVAVGERPLRQQPDDGEQGRVPLRQQPTSVGPAVGGGAAVVVAAADGGDGKDGKGQDRGLSQQLLSPALPMERGPEVAPRVHSTGEVGLTTWRLLPLNSTKHFPIPADTRK